MSLSASLGMQRRNLDLTSDLGTLVMPGDEFDIPRDSTAKVTLGPGLRSITDVETKEPKGITVCKPGILRRTKPNTFFVETKTRSVSFMDHHKNIIIIKLTNLEFRDG